MWFPAFQETKAKQKASSFQVQVNFYLSSDVLSGLQKNVDYKQWILVSKMFWFGFLSRFTQKPILKFGIEISCFKYFRTVKQKKTQIRSFGFWENLQRTNLLTVYLTFSNQSSVDPMERASVISINFRQIFFREIKTGFLKYPLFRTRISQ